MEPLWSLLDLLMSSMCRKPPLLLLSPYSKMNYMDGAKAQFIRARNLGEGPAIIVIPLRGKQVQIMDERMTLWSRSFSPMQSLSSSPISRILYFSKSSGFFLCARNTWIAISFHFQKHLFRLKRNDCPQVNQFPFKQQQVNLNNNRGRDV